ncbi:MAG: hypothetical protein IKW85_05080 [Muribaculaceae bacterium]|nr:hypothetical protein [Muribaculaceae bacterium]
MGLSAQANDVEVNANRADSRMMGYFYMPDMTVAPGETFVLPITFTCDDPIYSLGFKVSIPDGFSVTKVKKTARVLGSFSYGTPEGAVNIAIYNYDFNANNDILDGWTGILANLTVVAPEDASGDYSFTISGGNYGVVGNVGPVMYPEDFTATISVGTPHHVILGDVNDDTNVNLTDVILYINYILNDGAEGFVIENADFNEDSEVNLTDVIDMINYILNNVD